jgi:hypothetical protein
MLVRRRDIRRGVGVDGSERCLDAPADQRVAAVEALSVDPEQDLDRVPSPLGHRGGRHAAVEPGGHGRVAKVVGVFASGDAATSAVNGACRARRHTRPIVIVGSSPSLRSPTNSRPSGWTSNSWMWAWSRAVSGGGQAAAYEAVAGSLPRSLITRVALLSDGVSPGGTLWSR